MFENNSKEFHDLIDILKEKVKTKAKQTIAPQSKSSASTSQPTSSQNGSQDTNKSKQTSQAMA